MYDTLFILYYHIAMIDDSSSSRNTWFDRVITPLNSCSLETYTPIRNKPPTEEISDCKINENEGDDVIPLIIGCYQLNEQLTDTTTNGEDKNKDDNDSDVEKSSSRSGELRLYMISPSPSTTTSSTSIKFGNAHDVVQMESGVLDGKWRRRQCKPAMYVSACASGRMHLHSLEKNNSQQSWNLSHLTSSDKSDGNALCLSLAWNDFINTATNDDTNIKSEDQIVSSYSNGTVALHKVATTTKTNDDESQDVVSIEETQRWNAHTMFGCPSEVWTCSFLRGNENVVLSGADDVTLKVWDVRQTQRHIHKIGESEFEAGVTAISSHPSIDNMFAVGSYDEYVRIYDYRKMDQPMSKIHVGGGVWRIKWHPSCYHDGEAEGDIPHSGKMLVAAMHGGCRVVNVPILGGVDGDVEILSQFTAHESMAYGADWISSSKYEVVASCSFYDRQAFIWNPNSSEC